MMHIILLVLSIFFYHAASAEIYKWVDKDGQVHYSDNPDRAPAGAEAADIGPVNTVVAPPPEPRPATNDQAKPSATKPLMTASVWAEKNCTVRVRVLYTDGRFIPCVPTDEVPVYICDDEVPRKFSQYLGRRYRYENRESECGPEVYEGEILYLKK